MKIQSGKFPSARRRTSRAPLIGGLLLLGLLGLLVWLASRDTEVPMTRMEQDVTAQATGQAPTVQAAPAGQAAPR